ncbi:hypothetical protein Glove_692g17 [Diversispora epigaea]|uniref:Uncharacterized protein n=1 Tax=Diversispora epigaea TaxID=1348612 RepID=A0A397G351_9GLOM|nr:hypothetical protein Glove_692g17 [Diversispora epigaea]
MDLRLFWTKLGIIWITDGTPLQGLTGGGGVEYILTQMFGNGLNGFINLPDPHKHFTLEQVELAIHHKKAWQLLYDFEIILDIAKELPQDSSKAT